MSDPELHFDVTPSASNHFAWLRTNMAMQRTLLAAVRTSVSLIGFGFTVAQFFEKLVSSVADPGRPDLPRNMGLLLIGAGVISLAVFTWQYRRATAYLRGGDFAAIAGKSLRPMHTSTYMITGAVFVIGIAAFLSVLLRF